MKIAKFSLYHQFLMKRYMNLTIKNFYKEYERAIQNGWSEIPVISIIPPINDVGINKIAKERGVEKGQERIAEKFPIRFVPTHRLLFSREVFDISLKKANKKE